MNEILAYIGNNRRRVSVGYTLPDGKIAREFRKIDGQDREGIENAINHIKSLGVKEVIIELYRPNGSAEVICKTFTIKNDGVPVKSTLGATPTLFGEEPIRKPALATKPMPVTDRSQTPTNNRSMEQSWKDYALKTEQDKVSKLEAEVKRLTIENKNFDSKIRDFEKEMIKKDHELEKVQGQVESKSALGGFMEKAVENPTMMNALSGILTRVMGLPDHPQAQLGMGGDPNGNPQTEQLVGNIRAWMMKQPMEVQEQFYQLVFEVTNTTSPIGTINQLINLIKNGTDLKRTA